MAIFIFALFLASSIHLCHSASPKTEAQQKFLRNEDMKDESLYNVKPTRSLQDDINEFNYDLDEIEFSEKEGLLDAYEYDYDQYKNSDNILASFEKVLEKVDANNNTVFKETPQTNYEEGNEGRDDSDEEIEKEELFSGKYFRDTFMDRILEDDLKKRSKRDLKNGAADGQKNKVGKTKNVEVTGDTVLHLESEMSDVINSDLGTILKDRNKKVLRNDQAYFVADIMIHPSQFIPDINSFEGDKLSQEAKKKSKVKARGVSDGTVTFEGVSTSTSRGAVQSVASNETNGKLVEEKLSVDGMKHASGEEAQTENDPEEILGELHAKQVLHCKLDANITAVTWYKDGEEVLLSSAARTQHVVIARVGRQHAGTWACQGRDARGRLLKAKPMKLIVLEAPSAPYLSVSGRRLDASNVFLPAREDTELLLACHAEGGSPPAQLAWSDTPQLQQDTPHQGSDGSFTTARLLVKKSHHNTSITCEARHPTLPTPLVASTLLHVQYAPRFLLSRSPGFGEPLLEGSALSLRCEVDSNPPATPRWRKDDQDPPVPQSADGFLNFSMLQREHSGWYKCSASHAFGNFSSIGFFLNIRYEVDVTASPTMHKAATSGQQLQLGELGTPGQLLPSTSTNRKQQAALEEVLGGAVQLHCPPGSVSCWGKSSSSSAGTGPGGGPAGLLRYEGGELRCKGQSPEDDRRLGDKRKTIDPQGNGLAVVSPRNASVVAREGAPLVLKASYCAAGPPLRLLWLAGQRALVPGDEHGEIKTTNSTESATEDSCWSSSLEVESCRSGHAGEYALLVRTPRGLAEALFTVTVLAPSPQQANHAQTLPLHLWIFVTACIANIIMQKMHRASL